MPSRFRIGNFVGAVAVLSMLPAIASAQTTLTTSVDVTVQNGLTMTETQPLSFGTVVVIVGSDDTDQGEIGLAPDGVLTDATETNDSNLIAIGGEQPGSFTVDVGNTGFFDLTVTAPATTTLTNAVAPPTNGDFDVTAVVIGAPTAGTGITTPTDCSAGCPVTTDSNGLFSFPIGATLAVSAGDATFVDGAYSGNLTMSAAFR